MCEDTQVGKLKIQTGLWPRFWGYFTLVQCCCEQTERVITLSLCGQTLRRDYKSFSTRGKVSVVLNLEKKGGKNRTTVLFLLSARAIFF